MEFAHDVARAVALAVDLVNSYSPVQERDDLADPGVLASFLEDHGIGGAGPLGDGDLDQVRRLRARLREVFEAPDQPTAAGLLNRLLADSHANPQLTDHDGSGWHLHYTPARTPPGPRLAANAAMGLAMVVAEHGFDRLRVCQGDRCRDVFVDASRNRSRRFCSPRVCGNRASVAAYRARRRAVRA